MIRTGLPTPPLQPELGGGIVGPGGMDTDVAAKGGEAAVPGLVGDGPVGGAAQVGVGDEAGPQAVRAVRGGVNPGPGDRGLHQGVDRLRVQRPGEHTVAGADRTEQRPASEAGGGASAASSSGSVTGPSTRRWRRPVGAVMIGSVPAATRDSVDYPV